MNGIVQLVGYAAFATGMLLLWGLFFAIVFPPGLFLVFGLLLTYVWLLFAYLGYLRLRQHEVLQLLTTALECQTPLAPVLWSYVAERPQGMERRFWVGAILFILLPGYYWTFYRRHAFDERVTRVATLLEHGSPLFDALLDSPGVVSRETLLAVSLGEATGDTVGCLRIVSRRRERSPWAEVLPRLGYPAVLSLAISAMILFWLVFIAPRFEAMAKDYRIDFSTTWTPVATALYYISIGIPVVMFSVLILLALIVLFLRGMPLWFFSRLYRMRTQSLVLNMVGILLETGRTLPTALQMLMDSEAFSWFVARSLENCRDLATSGKSLTDSLAESSLIPPSCVALVRSAERLQRVPWALREIGTQLESQWIQRLRMLSLWLAPAMLLFLAAVVGAFTMLTIYPYVMFIEVNLTF